jgi:ABC-2 type transport system ATP-binding protein
MAGNFSILKFSFIHLVMTSSPVLLRAKSLQKTFFFPKPQNTWIKNLFSQEKDAFHAVQGIDLEIRKGEKVAFLGPNGAGKSTAIKMFCGILAPTGGSLEVCWYCPIEERNTLAYKIGAVFGQTSKLFYHLSPIDTYNLLWQIYQIESETLRKRITFLVEAFNLGEILNRPVRKLSLGQRMKAELVASLIHKPELLFLDEPTIGLDMMAKANLRDVINTMNQDEETSILLTSHDIGDVEEICDRIIIINHGTIVFDDSLKNLRTNYLKHKTIHIHALNRKQESPILPSCLELLREEGWEKWFQVQNSPEALKKSITYIMETYTIADMEMVNPDTESLIKELYQTWKNT